MSEKTDGSMTQPVQRGQPGQQGPPPQVTYTAGAVGAAIARRCSTGTPIPGEPTTMLFGTPEVRAIRPTPNAAITLVGSVVLDSGQRYGIALVEIT